MCGIEQKVEHEMGDVTYDKSLQLPGAAELRRQVLLLLRLTIVMGGLPG